MSENIVRIKTVQKHRYGTTTTSSFGPINFDSEGFSQAVPEDVATILCAASPFLCKETEMEGYEVHIEEKKQIETSEEELSKFAGNFHQKKETGAEEITFSTEKEESMNKGIVDAQGNEVQSEEVNGPSEEEIAEKAEKEKKEQEVEEARKRLLGEGDEKATQTTTTTTPSITEEDNRAALKLQNINQLKDLCKAANLKSSDYRSLKKEALVDYIIKKKII